MLALRWLQHAPLLLGLLLLGAAVSAAAKPVQMVYPLHVRERHVRKLRGRELLLHDGSSVVQGDVHLGYHYATLELGTPPQRFSVIIDTGSTITYVPCRDCMRCGPHHWNAPFNPRQSNTSSYMGCAADFCHKESTFTCRTDKCYYHLGYAEASSSSGFLVKDVYRFPNQEHDPVPVVFGCEDSETGEIYKQKADGLLGISKAQTAFHRQLVAAGAVEDVFSLCFGYPKGGALSFGATMLPTTKPYQYTPLVDKMPDFFNVKLESITVGRKKLDIPAADFDIGYGTVLDSGTTFNYLPTRTYLVMRNAIEQAMVKAKMLRDGGWSAGPGDVCYTNGPAEFRGLEEELPTFNLNLEGGAVLAWPPVRYLYYMSKGRYCLGVFDNSRDGFIVGALGSRNLLMRYEVAEKRLGFADADCASLGVAAATGELADNHTATMPAHTVNPGPATPSPLPEAPAAPDGDGSSSSSTKAASSGSGSSKAPSSGSSQEPQVSAGDAAAAGGAAGTVPPPAADSADSGSPASPTDADGERVMTADEAAADAERIAGAASGDGSGGSGGSALHPMSSQDWVGTLLVVGSVVGVVALAAVGFVYRRPLVNYWHAKTGGFTELTNEVDQDFEMAGLISNRNPGGTNGSYSTKVDNGLQSVTAYAAERGATGAASSAVRPLTPPPTAAAAATAALEGTELPPWQHHAAAAAAGMQQPHPILPPPPAAPSEPMLPVSTLAGGQQRPWTPAAAVAGAAAPRGLPTSPLSPMVSIPLGPAWPSPDMVTPRG